MAKFEYKIDTSYGGNFNENVLNDYGKEGRELCGVTTQVDKRYINGSVVYYYFKRQRE